MLSIENRNNKDLRTIGGLFFYCCDEMQDIKFCEALQLIIDTLKNTLSEKIMLSKEIISSIIDSFIEALPRMHTDFNMSDAIYEGYKKCYNACSNWWRICRCYC